MSRFSDTSAAMLLLALQVPGFAGVDPQSVPLQMKASDAPAAAAQAGDDIAGRVSVVAPAAPARRSGRPKHLLRCWQEGRLIFEGTGVAHVAKSSATVELRPVAGGDTTVQILDLKQGLCVLESPVAP